MKTSKIIGIGLILMGVILGIWYFFFSKEKTTELPIDESQEDEHFVIPEITEYEEISFDGATNKPQPSKGKKPIASSVADLVIDTASVTTIEVSRPNQVIIGSDLNYNTVHMGGRGR